jgi:hypothetical protein
VLAGRPSGWSWWALGWSWWALLLGVAGASGAALPRAVVPPQVGACWVGVRRPFASLRSGVFDYCRGHLRYAPGTLDCYHFVDEVCELLDPITGEWFDTHSPEGRDVFVCPDGPEPPVCPRLGP